MLNTLFSVCLNPFSMRMCLSIKSERRQNFIRTSSKDPVRISRMTRSRKKKNILQKNYNKRENNAQSQWIRERFPSQSVIIVLTGVAEVPILLTDGVFCFLSFLHFVHVAIWRQIKNISFISGSFPLHGELIWHMTYIYMKQTKKRRPQDSSICISESISTVNAESISIVNPSTAYLLLSQLSYVLSMCSVSG